METSLVPSVNSPRPAAGPPPTAAASPRTRVLVVDDQVLIRRGMSLLLDAAPDIEVVGQAADGVVAPALAPQLEPAERPRLG